MLSGDLEQLTGLLKSPRRPIIGDFSYFLRERTYCHANFASDSVLSWAAWNRKLPDYSEIKLTPTSRYRWPYQLIDLKQGKSILVEKGKLSDSIQSQHGFSRHSSAGFVGKYGIGQQHYFLRIAVKTS